MHCSLAQRREQLDDDRPGVRVELVDRMAGRRHAADELRSEERRVGKEWRSRWAAEVSKQKRPGSGRAGSAPPGQSWRSRSASCSRGPTWGRSPRSPCAITVRLFFFKQKTAYEIET